MHHGIIAQNTTAQFVGVRMEFPLLSTKLFSPRLQPRLVARQRLAERMNSALTAPLTLISAPAGFGKTTMLAQWTPALNQAVPVAWVSLDEVDNDPVRFWHYVVAAVSQ
jgi:LuxR family transcriptional regulator, maltose regulon positive regulatory protein